EEDDRRYTLLRLNNCKRGNKEHFDRLHEFTEGPHSDAVAVALYTFLISRQIINNVRMPLASAWKDSVISRSTSEDYCRNNKWSRTQQRVLKSHLYDEYVAYCAAETRNPDKPRMFFATALNLGYVQEYRVEHVPNGKGGRTTCTFAILSEDAL